MALYFTYRHMQHCHLRIKLRQVVVTTTTSNFTPYTVIQYYISLCTFCNSLIIISTVERTLQTPLRAPNVHF